MHHRALKPEHTLNFKQIEAMFRSWWCNTDETKLKANDELNDKWHTIKKKKGIQRHLYCINGSQNVQLQFTGRTLIESRDADGGGCCSTAGVIAKTEWRKACKAKMSLPPQLHITLPLLLMPHQNCQPVLKHKHGTYQTPVLHQSIHPQVHQKAKGE